MLAHHIKESRARVLEQMPAISNLDGLWCALGRSFAIAGAAVPGNKIDCRMPPKPCSRGATLTVWKKRYNTMPLQIADDGSVSASPTPCPIVNPDRAKWNIRAHGAAANRSQERVFADGNGESFRETMPWPAAKGETEAMNETLRVTALGALEMGARVNLELAMRTSDRFGGHIVQGHADGVAEVLSVAADGFARRLRIGLGPELIRYVVEEGSITLNGVSLTVVDLGDSWADLSLIPETLERTNLGEAEPRDKLNVECDVVAKYVERLVAPFAGKEQA